MEVLTQNLAGHFVLSIMKEPKFYSVKEVGKEHKESLWVSAYDYRRMQYLLSQMQATATKALEEIAALKK